MVLVPSARAAGLRAPALSRTLATPASSIGATKVPMSLFDKDRYINYQRIEDNLQVVRQRSVCASSLCPCPVLPAVEREWRRTSCILGVPSRPPSHRVVTPHLAVAVCIGRHRACWWSILNPSRRAY